MKKIGMRNIKTGISVFFATLAGYLGIVETPVYTVSVCVFSIKNTIKGSIKDSWSRVLGTLLGGLIGFLCALFFKGNIISATLGVILIIYICNILKISDSSAIASVTFISICLGVGNNHPLNYSIMRTIDTLVGVIIALVVNYAVSRKKYIKYLWSSFNAAYNDCLHIIHSMVKNTDFSSLYIKLNKKHSELQEYYNQLIDEIPYSKETHDINTLYYKFDIAEQLIHHIHGLYLIEKKVSSTDAVLNESIYKYHKNNILSLMEQSKEQK
ncbi:FUSC family protein [Terrisporobacter mayombei]|uniref:FUSC family protein n=1 Tax=Terrisporobacter mayombei TaxID=1541 RepID=A0ABY9Q5K0_9FIRM|nr:aromatic acid exporter family protein [Terrisporobacter mayombei]MCC3868697.1 FUSC family protein [Terrisporobacter mayombei]WMT83177.1 hypothetical protein TEMA_36780 [Terrisporobacter mayombei]